MLTEMPLETLYSTQHELLTAEEEGELCRRIREEGDDAAQKAQEKLVTHNIRLVMWIARTYLPRIEGTSMQFKDLVQEGVIGLFTATERYDSRIGRFSTYAIWWVRQAIRSAIKEQRGAIRIPPGIQDELWKVTTTIHNFQGDHKRGPTIEEVASLCDMTVRKVRGLQRFGTIRTLSIDQAYPSHTSKDESEVSVGALIADEQTAPADLLFEAEGELYNARQRIETALEELVDLGVSERNREIFRMFYGCDSGKKSTLEAVGRQFGLTKQAIHQILVKIWQQVGDAGSEMNHDLFIEELDRIKRLQEFLGH